MGRQRVEDCVVSVVSDLFGVRVAVSDLDNLRLNEDQTVEVLMAAEDELDIRVSCSACIRSCGLADDVIPDTPRGIISLVEQEIARG